MEKLPMCRICLVEDVHMFVVVNKHLHELYKKLTDVPFITKDDRPMLACSFCCAKLKQCWRFQRKCLKAEEMFTQMMNEDYKKDPSVNPGQFFNGLSLSPTERISIVDGAQTESDAIKQELPDVSEELDHIIDSEGGHQIERSPVSKQPKLDTQESKPKDTISAKQKKNRNNGKLTHVSNIMKKNENHTSKRVTRFKKPITNTQHGVTSRVNNTAFGISNRNNTDEDRTDNSDDSVRNRYKVSVKEKRFKCHICPGSFSKNSELVSHNRSHTGERPFKCDICPSTFSWKGDLTKHIRFHRGEKPFKCDICPRAFTLRSDLKRHVLIHTGAKPFKCDICPRSFHVKWNLKSHKRVHTGEKCFKCDICHTSFKQKNHLTTHIRFHTGEKPLTESLGGPELILLRGPHNYSRYRKK